MTRVVFIIGSTASGKGAAGRELAARIGGQIVSVDSMKVYRRMDIGTAKPSAAARAQAPHHCIDVVEPWESFSVAQFVQCADAAIGAIAAQGAVPLAVGGTSLYIKALSEGLFEGPSADPAIREELTRRATAEGLAELHKELAAIDPQAAGRIHANDQRRIIRALEVYRATGKTISSLQSQWDGGAGRYDCVFVGLRWDKDELNRRINQRVKRMVDAGLREEVAALVADPRGLSPQAAQAVGYAEVIEHLAGRCTWDEAVESIKVNTRQLAKKQRTWHRRFPGVRWVDCNADSQAGPVAAEIEKQIDAKTR